MLEPSPEDAVLACDLDGTLLRVNTFPVFVRFALVQLARQGSARAFLALALALVRRKVLRRTSHLRFKEQVHRAGLAVHQRQLSGWAAALLAGQSHPEVVRLVQDWPGTTVLCTAAPSCYADVLGALAGFDAVQATGWSGQHYVENVRQAKADRLTREVGRPIACAVSDDVDLDGPLLALAARPLVVDRLGHVSDWS